MNAGNEILALTDQLHENLDTFKAYRDEIDRIASTTSFNGVKVLDGTFGTAFFQVGANVGETISINLSTGVRASQIGQIATGVAHDFNNALSVILAKAEVMLDKLDTSPDDVESLRSDLCTVRKISL